MNYKYLAITNLVDFANKFPEYSMVEVIFSVLKSTNKSKDLAWLYELTDRELVTAIEYADLKETKETEEDED